jgi:hypothetical protein
LGKKGEVSLSNEIYTEQEKRLLENIKRNIKILQINKKILNDALKKGKYQSSYEGLKVKIQKDFVRFCTAEMIRKTTNVKEYCAYIQASFDKRNRRFSNACRYLNGKMLERELIQIRNEIQDEEQAYYINTFGLLPGEENTFTENKKQAG